LKAELIELKADLLKLYEELKKPVLERYNEVKDEVVVKTKPIVKRWTPIVKDVEVSRGGRPRFVYGRGVRVL